MPNNISHGLPQGKYTMNMAAGGPYVLDNDLILFPKISNQFVPNPHWLDFCHVGAQPSLCYRQGDARMSYVFYDDGTGVEYTTTSGGQTIQTNTFTYVKQ